MCAPVSPTVVCSDWYQIVTGIDCVHVVWLCCCPADDQELTAWLCYNPRLDPVRRAFPRASDMARGLARPPPEQPTAAGDLDGGVYHVQHDQVS